MKPTKSTKNQTKNPAAVKKIATKRTSTSAKARPTATVAAPRQEITVTTETIAACAYTLWEKDGRPHGRDLEYWLQAEKQLKQDSHSFAA